VRVAAEERWSENHLLAAMPAKDRAQLLPHLELLTLFPRESVYEAGQPMAHIYFPLDCVLVLVSSVASGATVEVGVTGREGMAGAPVLLGAKKSDSQILVLLDGKALRLPATVLRKEAKRSATMREVLLSYTRALLAQCSQLAACHRYHTPPARLARLILTACDRVETDELRITHNFLAHLLGTRRATVTEAANNLQKSGLIDSGRGRMRIVNRQGLELQSCDCYRVIARH
jgi:CRP-like cAMP-binding protein